MYKMYHCDCIIYLFIKAKKKFKKFYKVLQSSKNK